MTAVLLEHAETASRDVLRDKPEAEDEQRPRIRISDEGPRTFEAARTS